MPRSRPRAARPRNLNPGIPGNRVFVDSGGLIGLFSADDQHHAAADELFRGCIRQKTRLITTQLVLAEVHRFLLFNAGIAAAAAAVERISASPSLRIEYTTAEHHLLAREWLARLDHQVISYTDALSFSVMAGAGFRVALSFDDDFVIAGFERLRPDML